MHPARRLLDWLPEVDFALLAHGFLSHGRDYYWHVQDCLGSDPGVHEIVFSHCVQADCQTRVRDDVWPGSWDDVFTNYELWESSGEPNGYVWGSNWSLAYPGMTLVEGSTLAASWSGRIGRPFHEVVLETDRFLIRLIFHDVHHRKHSASIQTISEVIIPFPGEADA